jgi:hypothetical protein
MPATLTVPELGALFMRFGICVSVGHGREEVGKRFSVTARAFVA